MGWFNHQLAIESFSLKNVPFLCPFVSLGFPGLTPPRIEKVNGAGARSAGRRRIAGAGASATLESGTADASGGDAQGGGGRGSWGRSCYIHDDNVTLTRVF